MPPTLAPVTLTGRFVQLLPLSIDHVDALAAAAAVDRSSFGWTVVPNGADAMQAVRYGLTLRLGA